jgi:hypothetical protein
VMKSPARVSVPDVTTLTATAREMPLESPALTRERTTGRKPGKRTNASYKQMGVYLPADVMLEFDISCRRRGLEKSGAVESLIRGFLEGRFTI